MERVENHGNGPYSDHFRPARGLREMEAREEEKEEEEEAEKV